MVRIRGRGKREREGKGEGEGEREREREGEGEGGGRRLEDEFKSISAADWVYEGRYRLGSKEVQ
jgi:hypothetical protein